MYKSGVEAVLFPRKSRGASDGVVPRGRQVRDRDGEHDRTGEVHHPTRVSRQESERRPRFAGEPGPRDRHQGERQKRATSLPLI